MVAIIRVLYVDDEPTLLEIGKLCLEKEGQFIVDTLTSATEALERLNTVQYDAIVSDYQMSGMDGLEFLKYLRSHGQQLPFILFTGKGREEVMIEALNSGADFYLQKGGEPRSQFVELQHKIRLAVEQRQTKDKLSESRQRMTDIIDHLPDATFAIDLDGRVIVWNRAMEEMTGVPPEQILGTGNHSYALPFYGTRRPILLDLVLGEDKETERKYPQIIRKDKKLISEIYIPLLYGGKGAYVWFIASPLYDTHGNIIGAIESLRDITDRKVTEDALKENEQNYRALVESSFDGIVIHQNGSVVYANITAVHLLGGTSERQVLGIPILEFVHPDYRTVVQEYATAAKRDNQPIIREKFIRFDGGFVDVDVVATPVVWQGKPAVHVVFRDVTGTINAEALRESEERYRSIVGGQTEFISRFTLDGIHVFANDAYCRYSGKTREELIGHRFVPDVPGEEKEMIRRHFASLTTDHPSATIEHRIIMPDGTVRWQQWNDRAIFDTQETITMYQSVGRDITERVKMEVELKKFNRELERKVIARTSELADVNKNLITEMDIRRAAEKHLRESLDEKVVLLREIHHRVRNNLQIIIGLLNLQKRRITDERIIHNLLDSECRIRSMALVHEKLYRSDNLATINFGDYIKTMSLQLMSLYSLDPSQIKFTVEVKDISFDIDYAIPIGLLMNELISNALKHAFPDGQKGEITIDGESRYSEVVITIMDNGIGIPLDFDWRNTPTLGLHLVLALIDQVKGTIELVRQGGTTFIIRVPVAQAVK